MPVKLKNLTRMALPLNLTRGRPAVRVEALRSDKQSDGGMAQREVRLMLPDSITLLAGDTSEELPDVVKDCPEVLGAKLAGKLDVIVVKPSAPAPEAATAKAPVEPATVTPEPAKGEARPPRRGSGEGATGKGG